MFNISLEEKYELGDVHGIQSKYLFNNYYYKVDKQGSEGISEELVSLLLKHSSLKDNEYVKYECGLINSKYGCRSLNFIDNEKERLLSFNDLHFQIKGVRLDWYMHNFSMEERINYTINFFKENTGLDITNYLQKCITLDYIVCNIDRHFSNLAIIIDDKNIFKPAPIFDNGASLMSTMSIMRTKSIDENLEELKAKPFSDNINEMYEYFVPGFQVNFKELLKELEGKYDIKNKKYGYEQLVILKHQANKPLNSELNLENSLDVKISTLKAEYRVENGKLILNEAAQKECDKLIEQGIIKDIKQYPMYKDIQR